MNLNIVFLILVYQIIKLFIIDCLFLILYSNGGIFLLNYPFVSHVNEVLSSNFFLLQELVDVEFYCFALGDESVACDEFFDDCKPFTFNQFTLLVLSYSQLHTNLFRILNQIKCHNITLPIDAEFKSF